MYSLVSVVVFGGDPEVANLMVGVTPEGAYVWTP